jgi:hypothetical protein
LEERFQREGQSEDWFALKAFFEVGWYSAMEIYFLNSERHSPSRFYSELKGTRGTWANRLRLDSNLQLLVPKEPEEMSRRPWTGKEIGDVERLAPSSFSSKKEPQMYKVLKR